MIFWQFFQLISVSAIMKNNISSISKAKLFSTHISVGVGNLKREMDEKVVPVSCLLLPFRCPTEMFGRLIEILIRILEIH